MGVAPPDYIPDKNGSPIGAELGSKHGGGYYSLTDMHSLRKARCSGCGFTVRFSEVSNMGEDRCPLSELRGVRF